MTSFTRVLTILLIGVVFCWFSDGGAAEKKLIASDAGAGDQFGYSVSIDGDYAIVGARLEDAGGSSAGAAYIFDRNQGGTDNWGQVTKLTASDAETGDQFGYSVSISGDYAIVGAWGEDGGGSNAGAAYIFNRNQGGTDNWDQITKLTASDVEESDNFGWSVSISGDYAIVGARTEDAGGINDAGAAYIFYRNQGGADNWGEATKLTASDAEISDLFGVSVSIGGDYAIVAATQEDPSGVSNAGAVYIFDRNQGGPDNWGEVSKLTASDAQTSDQFGTSVSLDEDYAIVGANNEDPGGVTSAGAAYIFYRNQNGTDNWGEVTKLISSDAEAFDNFGYTVSISGDYALVGAWFEDAGGAAAGAVYSFLRNGSSWVETSKTLASDAQSNDLFGWSVSLSGDYALVGAEQGDAGGISDAGAAYIYESIADLSLPVELNSFTATAGEGQVTLEWVTQSEVANSGFEIHRSSEEDGNYDLISTYLNNPALVGQGNTSSTTHYSFIDEKVNAGDILWYKLADVNYNGVRTFHEAISVSVPITVKEFHLSQNYPNPFNPTTTIEFSIPGSEFVTLKIYNALGQEVATLVSERLTAGKYKYDWDANGLASGVYLYGIQAGDYVQAKKMVLLR